MKIFGEENLRVMDHKTGQILCVFNENGELETNDEALIKRLKPYFRFEENKPQRGNGNE